MSPPPTQGNPHDHPAVATLVAFFAAMSQWEREMIQDSATLEARFDGLDDDQVQAALDRLRDEQRERLAVVFDRFCDVGRSARRVTDGLHHGAYEPDYDPEREQIVAVVADRGDRVTVETQETHMFRNRNRYDLVRTADGTWKVRQRRKFYGKSEDRWIGVSL